jgi:hypothetical protein
VAGEFRRAAAVACSAGARSAGGEEALNVGPRVREMIGHDGLCPSLVPRGECVVEGSVLGRGGACPVRLVTPGAHPEKLPFRPHPRPQLEQHVVAGDPEEGQMERLVVDGGASHVPGLGLVQGRVQQGAERLQLFVGDAGSRGPRGRRLHQQPRLVELAAPAGIDRPDEGPAVRKHHDQPIAVELPEGLPDRCARYPECCRKLTFGQPVSRIELAREQGMLDKAMHLRGDGPRQRGLGSERTAQDGLLSVSPFPGQRAELPPWIIHS